MLRLKFFAAAVTLTLAAGAANATTFNWEYDSLTVITSVSASGTLEATLFAPGQYLVTSITGTDTTGGTISGPNSLVGGNNILYYPASAPGYVDSLGIEFSSSGSFFAGNYAFRYNSSLSHETITGCIGGGSCDPGIVDYGIFSATIVPEVEQTPLPAALPLLSSGVGLLGFLGWRRKRKTA